MIYLFAYQVVNELIGNLVAITTYYKFSTTFAVANDGKGRTPMKYKLCKKISKIKGFSAGRSGMKAYKTAILQVPTMKSLDK